MVTPIVVRKGLKTSITLLCIEVKMEADSSDERDGDKSAAFTVLLHGSLKVEQMVALVQIGFAAHPFQSYFCLLSLTITIITFISVFPTDLFKYLFI